MRLFQDKREHRQILFSWLTLVFVFVVALILVRAVFNIYPKYQLATESRRTIQIEEKELDARRNQLETDISKLSSKTGEDSELRSKYQVSKPGEDVLVIVGESNKSNVSKDTGTSKKVDSNKAFDYIKSLFGR